MSKLLSPDLLLIAAVYIAAAGIAVVWIISWMYGQFTECCGSPRQRNGTHPVRKRPVDGEGAVKSTEDIPLLDHHAPRSAGRTV
ncbi:hypothetical protein GA0070624_1298 [Micromonospora rhizosphaerae]|uniref:Uncharacterized protein n=1 Tax=Micromonospora rhizosphaerae TaxID=568872 RepID=A0A1C6RJU9_9ACTN|nr:hypothetical protein GA0070624_1298 [Micromonospora rhizosphaerae]